MEEKELLRLTPTQLIDLGICPTCLNKKYNGVIYGDDTNTLLYRDEDIECFFVSNPRSEGHMVISTQHHYKDMSETPDCINEKIVRFSKEFMILLKSIFHCESVYMCTMCDGPMNHYHIQLIPRYSFEKRGSTNFVKTRGIYKFQKEKFLEIKSKIYTWSKSEE